MDLQQLMIQISNHEVSLFLMILKIFKARVSHDYLADNNLELWACEHHDHPYLFSYPSDVNLANRQPVNLWEPRREYSYFVNSCDGCWCEIYFECKVTDIHKDDYDYFLGYFFCFDQDDYVEPPFEVKVICS